MVLTLSQGQADQRKRNFAACWQWSKNDAKNKNVKQRFIIKVQSLNIDIDLKASGTTDYITDISWVSTECRPNYYHQTSVISRKGLLIGVSAATTSVDDVFVDFYFPLLYLK